jgi:large subunit ribosomal protein L9
MKIILNQDVPNLGEFGDVKIVADGYARNFLFPKGMAVSYSAKSVAVFEKKRAEIESHKETKRKHALSIRERIEAEELAIAMPAGPNGKLYGAVTGTTIADELQKKGIAIDRKRIEIPNKAVKNTGKYHILIRLYEKEEATLTLVVANSEQKKESKAEKPKKEKRETRATKADVPTESVPAEDARPETEPRDETAVPSESLAEADATVRGTNAEPEIPARTESSVSSEPSARAEPSA